VALSLGFFGLSYALTGDAERLQGQLATLGAPTPIELKRRAPPPPPPPPAPEVEERLDAVSGFLEAEIAEGIVTVFEQGNTLVIRIAGAEMFGPGSDVLQPGYPERLARVAAALNDQPGSIIVAGHSDSIPISTAKFPNNQVLSLHRAEAVMASIAKVLEDPARMTAEGRAEREPIADNGTRAGRAQNRRVEVILVK